MAILFGLLQCSTCPEASFLRTVIHKTKPAIIPAKPTSNRTSNMADDQQSCQLKHMGSNRTSNMLLFFWCFGFHKKSVNHEVLPVNSSNRNSNL
jgi:hypothetical protein